MPPQKQIIDIPIAGGIETEEQLEAALAGLRERCIELIAAGKRVLVQ